MSLYLASIYFQTERSLNFLSKLNARNARGSGTANARYIMLVGRQGGTSRNFRLNIYLNIIIPIIVRPKNNL